MNAKDIEIDFTRTGEYSSVLTVTAFDDIGFEIDTNNDDRQEIVYNMLCQIMSYASTQTIDKVLGVYNHKQK